MAEKLTTRLERLEALARAPQAIPDHHWSAITRDIRDALPPKSWANVVAMKLDELTDDELIRIESIFRQHTGQI